MYLRRGPGDESTVWQEAQVSEVGDQMDGVLVPPLGEARPDVSVTGHVQSIEAHVGALQEHVPPAPPVTVVMPGWPQSQGRGFLGHLVDVCW
jgi:hypothetical protein